MSADAESETGSATSYFSLLLERAQRAGQSGNYAIAAGFVQRDRGGELVIIAENTLIAGRDPAGHAEMNALRNAHRLARATEAEQTALVAAGTRDGWLKFQRCGHDETESLLFTTLEPCPMCTVAILNAGIDRVVIAAPDPEAGTLEQGRLQCLPQIWGELAARLDIVWVQSANPTDAASYLPADLHTELIDTFARSRTAIDDQLAAHGVLDHHSLRTLVQERYDTNRT